MHNYIVARWVRKSDRAALARSVAVRGKTLGRDWFEFYFGGPPLRILPTSLLSQPRLWPRTLAGFRYCTLQWDTLRLACGNDPSRIFNEAAQFTAARHGLQLYLWGSTLDRIRLRSSVRWQHGFPSRQFVPAMFFSDAFST